MVITLLLPAIGYRIPVVTSDFSKVNNRDSRGYPFRHLKCEKLTIQIE